MKPLISIIIPVYNVQEYLECCVSSVIDQSYSNLEVILVNDGSTDNSPLICDEFGKRDSRVKVIHKKNGGLSDSRNVGIDASQGTYLLFLDGDDFLKNGCLNEIGILLSENFPDVLISLLIEYYSDNNILEESFPLSNEQINCMGKYELINGVFNTLEWSAPKYIIKKELVIKNNLKFKVGYLHEDVHWTTNLFLVAESFSLYSTPYYYHRMNREGSITNTHDSKRVADVIAIVSELILSLRGNSVYENIFDVIASRLSRSTHYYVSIIYSFDIKEREELLNLIRTNLFILSYSKKFSHKLFFRFIKLFGVEFSLKLIYKLKSSR